MISRSYLEKNLSPEAFHKLQQSKPPSKVASLVELIEQAKKSGHINFIITKDKDVAFYLKNYHSGQLNH